MSMTKEVRSASSEQKERKLQEGGKLRTRKRWGRGACRTLCVVIWPSVFLQWLASRSATRLRRADSSCRHAGRGGAAVTHRCRLC